MLQVVFVLDTILSTQELDRNDPGCNVAPEHQIVFEG